MSYLDEPKADTRAMYMVHHTLRREFRLMPEAIQRVPAGDKERAEAVAAHIDLVVSFLHGHHHEEDVHFWPRLLERGPEEIGPFVHVMEHQHERIECITAELNQDLADWRSTADPESGEALAAAIDALQSLLVDHLATEEEGVLPLIDKYITQGEWDAMVQAAGAEIPPEQLPLVFGMMMYEGDPDVVEHAIAQMPPDLRPVIGQIATEAYATRAQLVHGTATPPRIGATYH